MKDGLMYILGTVDELTLVRPGISVELCEPGNQSPGWFTMKGEFQEDFHVNGNPEQAVEARLVFKSWSPGYFNGICINDFLVFFKRGTAL